jgi:hypothetical protein
MHLKPVTRALSLSFICSFLVLLGSIVGAIFLGPITAPHDDVTSVEALLLMLMLASGPVWYVSLGILANRLGRNWLVWVGLSFLTAPIGPLITFPLMLGHIRAARHSEAVSASQVHRRA